MTPEEIGEAIFTLEQKNHWEPSDHTRMSQLKGLLRGNIKQCNSVGQPNPLKSSGTTYKVKRNGKVIEASSIAEMIRIGMRRK